MGHSIQKVEGRVGIFNDLDLIALVGLLSEQVSRQPERFSNIATTVQGWIDDLAGYGPGVVDLGLGQVAGSESTVKEFETLVSELAERLGEEGAVVPASVLNARCGASGVTFGDFPVEPLQDALLRLRALVLGDAS